MKILMIGPQGSGKGTQAEIIAKEFNIPHISTGDIFRENIKKKTELGKTAQQYMNQGLLVPDEVTNRMVRERISQPDCDQGFILDGYPRTLNQLVTMFEFTAIDVALDIEISDDESIERISGRRVCRKCGSNFHINYHKPKKDSICDACGGELYLREDDEPDALLKRLEIYHEQTQPILELLKKKGILKIINGSQDIAEVFRDIKVMLNKNL
ncbi:MAG: adenylate kinase [Nanoarchaeota archaeon]